ncbi:MAG: type IV secretory system conjugative DNA transfer family protein, partial [Pseudomonadota bacterium]
MSDTTSNTMQTTTKLALMSAGVFGLTMLGLDHEALAQSTRDFWGNPAPYGYKPLNLAYLRLTIIAVSSALGFALGWYLSPAASGIRQAVTSCIMLILVLVAVLNNGILGWTLTPLVSIGAFMAAFGYWARRFVERLRETPTTFGSAAWAKFDELVLKGMITLEGFRLGFTRDDKGVRHPLGYGGDRHIGTVAPNRSGKGTCSIIPQLLTYPGSVLVVDPKGENAMITADQRRLMGQAVHIVDPWNITGMDTACFNPIDWLKAGDIDISDNAMLLADAIIMMNG